MRDGLIIIILCLAQICFGQSKGGQWQFDNNGNDTAAWDTQDDNGSLMNNAFCTDSLPLQQGSAYLYLANVQPGDYVKVEDSNDLDFNNENIGISAWIFPTMLLNDVYYLVNKGQQDANPKTTNYALRISNSQHLEFLVRDANNQAHTAASSFTIPVNQWTFVAAYYNYSAGKVYLWNTPSDLATADSASFSQNLVTNDHPLAIGGWYSAATALSKPFKGRMDDVRISGRMTDVIPGLTALRNNTPEDDSADRFDFSPNPVCLSRGTNQLKVNLIIRQSQPLTLTVFNILGQQLYESRIFPLDKNSEFVLNLPEILGEHYSSGFYFIRLNGTYLRQIKKLLIIK
jgi:Concanavalin A-like lectin/glucanases superfamily